MSKIRYVTKATIYDKKGKIIAEAENSYQKTHPIQLKYATACGQPYKAFLHAEVLALIRSKGKGYRIVVERYNKLGEPMLAKPCPICEMAILESHIERVEYTT